MAFTGLVFFLKPDVLLGKDLVLTSLLGRIAFLFAVALLFHDNGYGNFWVPPLPGSMRVFWHHIVGWKHSSKNRLGLTSTEIN